MHAAQAVKGFGKIGMARKSAGGGNGGDGGIARVEHSDRALNAQIVDIGHNRLPRHALELTQEVEFA